MSAPKGNALALRPFTDILAIAAAQLALDMVDDVALFRLSCFDRNGRRFSNFRRLSHNAGGLFDQGGDGLAVRDIDSVAARDLNNRGAGPFRRELLCESSQTRGPTT
jgi:hypothetical protein